MKKLIVILVSIYSVFTTNLMAQVPNYVPTNGLVAWYPFTGNAIDSSGNGNNGTVNGATLTTDRFGNANKAYSFDGVNDFVKVLDNDLLDLTQNLTLSAWISPNSVINEQAIIGKGKISSQTGYSLLHNVLIPKKTGISIQNQPIPASEAHINSSTLNLNTWYQLVGTYNGSKLKLYVNGILVDTVSTSIQLMPNSLTDLYIGCELSGFRFFNGKIDDIGIWNRALTQQEITALFNSCGKNLAISPTNNSKMIGTNATFTATVSDTNPSYIWQSNFGQGYVTLNNFGNYSGTSTNSMSISNVQLSNHMEPIRAITTSGTCKDTSNIAYVKITDTCITKINDTIKITKYDTIKVMDTLVINANLSGISAPNNTNRIIVYPNPAKDHITIDYGVFSRMSGYTVKITNTLGQTVFTSPINQQSSFINLSTWTGKGLYYLQIIDPNSNMIENRKIVLQ
jgi:hypothetical protein